VVDPRDRVPERQDLSATGGNAGIDTMPEHSFSRVAATVLLLLAAVPGSAAVAPADPAQSPTSLAAGPTLQQDVPADSVRLIVSVDRNGSADWTVQYWTRLDDENTTAAFESLQADIEASPANYSARFASRMRSTVAAAENATGREMNATDFGVRAETRTPPQYGVVSYTFRWTGFAAVDGDTIRVGDAIEALFLDDRTRLVVQWPDGYAPTQTVPDPDERRSAAVVWRGSETSFVAGEPRIVLEPSPATTTTAAAGGGGGGGGSDGETGTPTPDAGSGTMPVLGVGLLAALGVAVAWRYRDRLGVGAGGRPDGAADESDAATTASADEGEGGGETAAAGDELLSNEERVLAFVRERGGRVKQQEIVEAFDWTEARTSQIVRDLRDDGALEGFRLGRENVLKLTDEE
jgi:hypothetical protein